MVKSPEASPEKMWPDRVVIDENLAISRLTAEDAPDFYAAVDAERVRLGRYMEWASHFTPEKAAYDSQNLEKEMDRGNLAAYKIEYERKFAGIVMLTDRRNDEAELSIWLITEATGKRVASRSARALLEIGFANWQLAAAIQHIDATNDASKKLASQIGAHKIMTATPASGGSELWEIPRREYGHGE